MHISLVIPGAQGMLLRGPWNVQGCAGVSLVVGTMVVHGLTACVSQTLMVHCCSSFRSRERGVRAQRVRLLGDSWHCSGGLAPCRIQRGVVAPEASSLRRIGSRNRTISVEHLRSGRAGPLGGCPLHGFPRLSSPQSG